MSQPGVSVCNVSEQVDVDFPWDARHPALCVFGQQLQAQTTPEEGNTDRQVGFMKHLY